MDMSWMLLAAILMLLSASVAAEEAAPKFYSWDPSTKAPGVIEGEEIDIYGERGTYYFIRPPLKADANGDGDTEDEGDYVLYNALYVANTSAAELVLSFYNPGEADVIEVGGREYLIVFTDPYQQKFRYAKRYHHILLPRKASILVKEAEPFPEDVNLKVEYVYPTVSLGNVIGTLAFFVGNSYHSSVHIFKGKFPRDITTELKDPFKRYKIYVLEADSEHARLVVVERGEDNAVWVNNGDQNVLGYRSVAVFTLRYGGRGEMGPSLGSDARNFVHFRGQTLELSRGCVDINATLYELCYDGVRKLSLRMREEFVAEREVPVPEETPPPSPKPPETTPPPTAPPAEKPEEKRGLCGPTLLVLLALPPLLLRRSSFAPCIR
jgi:hypothetical protein